MLFLQAIARDVGPRELTVRQMLHSAALRSRQPSMTAAAADHLVRLSISGLDDPALQEVHGISPGSVRGDRLGLHTILDLEAAHQSDKHAANSIDAPKEDAQQQWAQPGNGSTGPDSPFRDASQHPVNK